MSEPYVGEIRMFAGNFAPIGWAFCDGQPLPISENDTLFQLIGTTYGGDGETTFNLPDLRGRIPIHVGSGSGLTLRQLGQQGGQENVTLTTANLPSHSHGNFQASTAAGSQSAPATNVVAASPNVRLFRPVSPVVNMSSNAVTSVGGGQQHTNLMPFQCISFIISLYGIYPSQG